MARYRGPVCKLCRNEDEKLFLKGERCYSAKCGITKRPYGSGQHGQSRKKLSEYGLHLREKQKLRFKSGIISEKQFSRYFKISARKDGVTGTNLLQILDSRIDNVVYKAGFAASKSQARQLIKHGHFLVDGRKVDIPSYRLKIGQEISVKIKSEKLIKSLMEDITLSATPRWLVVDKAKLAIKYDGLPERDELDPNTKEQLIIEYYSR